jgi:L,D-peptidoglycan transpeptidase YkuD (ErfK/YbiS/YcfS/YnhG family)
MRFSVSFFFAFFISVFPLCAADVLPSDVRQLVVSIAPDWNSIHGRLLALERQPDGTWKPALGPVPVLFGKNGLVWGLGVLGSNEQGPHKVERDARAPAGVFKIGTIYTYDVALPKGASYPFHTVTAADAWVDSPALPKLYNRHVTVDLNHPPAWFESQKMRHNDEAYRYLIEIRHNADAPVVGAGSAIFFHTRRGPDRPTWGCTTMSREDLVGLIRWLRADEDPHYALLPWNEYRSKWAHWGLPSPETLRAIAP